MPSVSLGEMAQHFMLRRQTTAASKELMALSADLAKGTASDVHRHLGGALLRLSSIEASLARNAAFATSIDRGLTHAAATQTALERLHQAAGRNANDLLTAAQSGQAGSLSTAAIRARAALEDALMALNTRVEGISLFAGTATDAMALPDASGLLVTVSSAIAPATAPSDVDAALEAWLAAPSGFAAQVFGGNTDTRQIAIANGQSLRLDITAADPALHQTVKGLILGALLNDPALTSDLSSQQAIAKLAGDALLRGADDRVALAARVGIVEEGLNTVRSRLSGESSVLQQARSDLVAIDGYETATRLQDTESRLDLIYTLTARLTRLSLAGYL